MVSLVSVMYIELRACDVLLRRLCGCRDSACIVKGGINGSDSVSGEHEAGWHN